METVDWVAVAVIGLAAVGGLRRGFVATALALGGLVVGAIVGARVAPHILDDPTSPYTSAVALAGAVVGALLLHTVASMAGSVFRAGFRVPGLRSLDSVGGLLAGAAIGVALVWVVGAVALQIPQDRVRREARGSEVLERLNDVVSPGRLLDAFGRLDLPSLSGPAPPAQAPAASILREAGVRRAAASVVRVTGTACGLRVSGSGWTVGRGLVITAAHVVAGQDAPRVQVRGRGRKLAAQVVAFDRRDDVALLRVRGLAARALRFGDPDEGQLVGILGFPRNGPYRAAAGRLGRTENVVSEDAYGKGPVLRPMTSLRGRIDHGSSGGPAVDAAGVVRATVFGARKGDRTPLAVPAGPVRAALERARAPAVSTGDCIQ